MEPNRTTTMTDAAARPEWWKPKPADAQCSECTIDEPHDPKIMAGCVLCGGCGRVRPAVEYVLAARTLAAESTLRQVRELAAKWDEHQADYAKAAEAELPTNRVIRARFTEAATQCAVHRDELESILNPKPATGQGDAT